MELQIAVCAYRENPSTLLDEVNRFLGKGNTGTLTVTLKVGGSPLQCTGTYNGGFCSGHNSSRPHDVEGAFYEDMIDWEKVGHLIPEVVKEKLNVPGRSS